LLLGLVFARYGLDLRIVNPLQSHKHQQSRVRKTKTDAVDGYVLATMCATERDLPAAAHLHSQHVLLRLQQGQLHALDKELEALLTHAAADRNDLAKLQELPGFSPLVAGLVATAFNRQAKSERSWVAYAGLDVSVRESGTWRGRGKLTKRGNSFLRKRLYCAAWGAVMNYTGVRAYYDRLKAAGRNHVEALCIIARKLLRIAYAILVKGKEYDHHIAFA
jgi:transposase